jgi:hypothetical protein
MCQFILRIDLEEIIVIVYISIKREGTMYPKEPTSAKSHRLQCQVIPAAFIHSILPDFGV